MAKRDFADGVCEIHLKRSQEVSRSVLTVKLTVWMMLDDQRASSNIVSRRPARFKIPRRLTIEWE
jgi:hypothetical protein